MRRRDVLFASGSLVAAAGSEGAGVKAAPGLKAAPGPFIETGDGAFLFCKEWGTGKPVLFLHSWAVHSDLWQYQMIDLSNRGIRCIAYDMRGHGRSSDPGARSTQRRHVGRFGRPTRFTSSARRRSVRHGNEGVWKAKKPASHTPWKSLRDYHFPTASTAGILQGARA